MRLLLYADPHWSVTSSIVRSRGDKYSTRLENLITSLNWVEDLAREQRCDNVICLGDFFDTSQLNSEEITALGEIAWCDAYHYFIAGNHEMGRSDSSFSSSAVFDLCPRSIAISKPLMLPIYDQSDTRLMCLPYVLEKDRKPLCEYIKDAGIPDGVDNLIVFSHNDIKGIQMGMFVSTCGFSVDEIQDNCKLFVNGHLHNGGVVAPGVINLGNLTGQNFSEDAYKYDHNVMIIDTLTHEVRWVENPHAFKFYKLDFTTYTDKEDSNLQSVLQCLRSPAVVSVRVSPDHEAFVRDLLSTMDNIVESRVTVCMSDTGDTQEVSEVRIGTDHISKFVSYIEENLGKSDIIIEELINIGGVVN
jgi:DNA repair exonuclease SbcCD nuclease subunit